MTAQEALKIGKTADGYVKCTYAKLHSLQFAQFGWSLQKSHFWENKSKTDFTAAVADPDDTIYTFDYPVVELLSISDDGKTAFVKLTDYAKKLIQSKSKTQYTGRLMNGEFAVKECAIDWIPTSCSATVDLDEQIAEAKRKLDNAKALLAAAGAIAII